uniref:disco-interacting protein 2 homolog C-like n=1 Tax=Myxine glutinosa TaxID=7769 RepID=UPI00358E3E04
MIELHFKAPLRGDITQKGYEKKRAKLLAAYIPQSQAGVDPSLHKELHLRAAPAPTGKHGRRKECGSRDDRYRSDVHTEAVQAALAKHKEKKMAMPMPSKRRSFAVHAAVNTCTPPETSSASEDENSLRRRSKGQCLSLEQWVNQAMQGTSTTSSSASSASSLGSGPRPGSGPNVIPNTEHRAGGAALADVLAQTHLGMPINSRVSSKIQQLLNTLKRPKRPPLKEFFVDDLDELLEVQRPDPNQPRPEGDSSSVVKGDPLAVMAHWPHSLEAALQHWASAMPKAPCLTTLDTSGRPVHTLTYGKLWRQSLKVAYTLLNKLGTKQEPLLKPSNKVALVYPNTEPGVFMVAFYSCLLAGLVPVPIEVPLTTKDAGSLQTGFLLGSCGVGVALTSDSCLKGLPKATSGDVVQFKGWPPMTWFVTNSKHLSKPPKDWMVFPRESNGEPAYIEYKSSKEGCMMGVAVPRAAMLTHCQALIQACQYTQGDILINVLDFKRDVGLWHAILTSVMNLLHVICVPYALMKTNPLSWVQKVSLHK